MSQEPNFPLEGEYLCHITEVYLSRQITGRHPLTQIKCADIVTGRRLILYATGDNRKAWTYIAGYKPVLTLRVKHRRLPPTATEPERLVFGITLRAIGHTIPKLKQA